MQDKLSKSKLLVNKVPHKGGATIIGHLDIQLNSNLDYSPHISEITIGGRK